MIDRNLHKFEIQFFLGFLSLSLCVCVILVLVEEIRKCC